MSELKKCPFCGGKAFTSTFFDWDDLEYMPIEVNDCDAEVTCENERCINGWYLSPKAWNTRPIEDALNARIAELEAEKCVLIDQQREAKNILIDKKLHVDSLYEEGYKLQKRIAELEAENIRLGIEYQRMRLALGDIAINSKRALKESPTDHLTAQWRQERQDDKSSNDTQTQTIVYGKERE